MTGTTLPPPKTPVPSAGGPRHTRLFLLAYYALAVVWGVRNIRHAEPSRLDLWVPLGEAVCLGWWAIVDARRRGRPLPMLAKPWFFLAAGLVVPAYVVWSRRWRGVGWVVLHAVLWYVVAAAVMVAGGLLLYGERWLQGIPT